MMRSQSQWSQRALVLAALLGMVVFTQSPALADKDADIAALEAKLSTAAPQEVVKNATLMVRGADGKMTALRKGTNNFVCLMAKGDPVCGDRPAMAFFGSRYKKQPPPAGIGLIYMLAGDSGSSNTDPLATKKTDDNHWIVTGPHLMLSGLSAEELAKYPSTPDADPTAPYVMWHGTPWAHLMLPVFTR